MSPGHVVERPASIGDAAALARLIDIAGEGLPSFVWAEMAAPGEAVLDVGRSRAEREEGAFSYRNATIVEVDGEVAACLIGYPLPGDPVPVEASLAPRFVPLQELENLAPATWYVNALATFPRHRGQGLGARLLGHAARRAVTLRLRGVSLIASDANAGALRLYRREGFEALAERPMVKSGWTSPGERWLLLVKRF